MQWLGSALLPSARGRFYILSCIVVAALLVSRCQSWCQQQDVKGMYLDVGGPLTTEVSFVCDDDAERGVYLGGAKLSCVACAHADITCQPRRMEYSQYDGDLCRILLNASNACIPSNMLRVDFPCKESPRLVQPAQPGVSIPRLLFPFTWCMKRHNLMLECYNGLALLLRKNSARFLAFFEVSPAPDRTFPAALRLGLSFWAAPARSPFSRAASNISGMPRVCPASACFARSLACLAVTSA